MENRINRGNRSQRLVTLLLILTGFCFSLSAQQEVPQLLNAEWKEGILENQRFTLKILTPYPGKLSVSIKDPDWPEGIQKVSGPYTAQSTIQKEDGTFGTVVQVIYTLRSQGAGIYRIPPLTVLPRTGGDPDTALEYGPLSTRELYIPVLQNDERHLKYPLQLSWENLPEEIYTGQSVPLVLIMNNLEEIDLPESVSLPSPGGAILEEAEGLGDIGFTGLEDATLFNVPMKAWILTPSREGLLTLPSASVSISGVTRTTGRTTIKVLPLPDQVQSSGAVGDFSIDYSLSETSVSPGTSVILTIRIEGTGNLNLLNMPEPVIPSGLSYSVKENLLYAPSSSGYKGAREMVYTFRPETLDRYEILIPSYSYFNPAAGRIETRGESRYEFEVTSLLAGQEDSGRGSFTLMELSDSRAARGWAMYTTPLLYLALLPGVLFLMMVLVLKKLNPALLSALLLSSVFLSSSMAETEGEPWIRDAQALFDQSSYNEALALYEEHSESWNGNGTFLYNRGVLEYLSGSEAEGLADLRRAQKRLPMDKRIQQTILQMEEIMKLKNQHNQVLFFHPDLLFLLLVLVFNLSMIALGYSIVQNRPLPIILFVLFFSLSLAAGGELLRTAWLLDRPLAVIREECVVKKIPEEIGSDWLKIDAGTTVSFIQQERDFSLVTTSFGLEGWVRNDKLISLDGEEL